MPSQLRNTPVIPNTPDSKRVLFLLSVLLRSKQSPQYDDDFVEGSILRGFLQILGLLCVIFFASIFTLHWFASKSMDGTVQTTSVAPSPSTPPTASPSPQTPVSPTTDKPNISFTKINESMQNIAQNSPAQIPSIVFTDKSVQPLTTIIKSAQTVHLMNNQVLYVRLGYSLYGNQVQAMAKTTNFGDKLAFSGIIGNSITIPVQTIVNNRIQNRVPVSAQVIRFDTRINGQPPVVFYAFTTGGGGAMYVSLSSLQEALQLPHHTLTRNK